jgi:hypothetical protein
MLGIPGDFGNGSGRYFGSWCARMKASSSGSPVFGAKDLDGRCGLARRGLLAEGVASGLERVGQLFGELLRVLLRDEGVDGDVIEGVQDDRGGGAHVWRGLSNLWRRVLISRP